MLDIKFIRENVEVVKKAIANKRVDFNLDYFLTLDEHRRSKIQEVEGLRAEQNRVTEEIAELAGGERERQIAEMKELKAKLGDLEFELKALEDEYLERAYEIPNIPLDDVPVGPDESGNSEIRKWGDIPTFDFEPKDHVALGEALGVIDIERAGKVVGSRFGYFKGAAALLEFALIQHTTKVLTSPDSLQEIARMVGPAFSPKPFVPVVPPVMIRPDVFRRMARLSPADKDERYYLPQDDLYLVGSAEHTLGSMHMDEIIEESDLPIRYLGFSTSFRREAGSYGKDTRGVLRVHQFDKLEMESFTTADQSLDEHNFFVAVQEYLLRSLNLPYRVVFICTGDMGKPDAHQVDMECWFPSQGRYRETHTADYMTDFQARRLNTRIRRNDGTTELAHMNDATAFAIGRTIIAILENYQRKDGSVKIPEALLPYMHGIMEIKK